ncbi:MAG: cyclase family protein [Anaerolineaceae bacterium]|nr:cyclase family protein [Anaerolineaceae bacterium]
MIYDITRPVHEYTTVWPGDQPYRLRHSMRISEGAAVNLTAMEATLHLGTHMDAWYHCDDEGATAAGMPLAACIGPARLLTVSCQDGPLAPADLAHVSLAGVERLLLRSEVSQLPEDQWPETWPWPGDDLIELLANGGLRLLGLDAPSVDAFDSETLPGHHALRRRGIVTLESLWLRDVPDGDYELLALPLRLEGACASPVRAILRPLAA